TPGASVCQSPKAAAPVSTVPAAAGAPPFVPASGAGCAQAAPAATSANAVNRSRRGMALITATQAQSRPEAKLRVGCGRNQPELLGPRLPDVRSRLLSANKRHFPDKLREPRHAPGTAHRTENRRVRRHRAGPVLR